MASDPGGASTPPDSSYGLGRHDVTEALKQFAVCEHGLTTVEYAVAGALITVALVGAFTLLSGSVSGTMLTIDAILPG